MIHDTSDNASSPRDSTDSENTGTRRWFIDRFIALLEAIRPHQWVKNLFVLAPVFFSKSYYDPTKLGFALLAAGSYCLAAGSVYLINDIIDIDEDRQHPVKKHRPIPSGRLPLRVARPMAWAIAGSAIAAGLLLETSVGLLIAGYIGMNLAYSKVLKHIPFVDVGIIATGFLLRILVGAYAIGVHISEWLLTCTFLLALYLGLGKRQHELDLTISEEKPSTRRVLDSYKRGYLDFALLFVGGLTIAAYTIYTLTAALPDQPLRTHQTPFTSSWLPTTIPFVVFGIARFYQIVHVDKPESPTNLILHDIPFVINIATWGIVMFAIGFQ